MFYKGQVSMYVGIAEFSQGPLPKQDKFLMVSRVRLFSSFVHYFL
jgi:hypothetical protein